MPLGEAIEITDAWLEIPLERERKVIVAAARALHRRASAFASASEALLALGLRFSGFELGPEAMALDQDGLRAAGSRRARHPLVEPKTAPPAQAGASSCAPAGSER